MLRKIITIDEEACDGCGLCADACHEGAISMVEGKARLLYENYCDGLGDCLPACPTGAISFEEREAAAYDEAAVLAHQNKLAGQSGAKVEALACGCPGTESKRLEASACEQQAGHIGAGAVGSQLMQWPVQIQLVPVNAPYFEDADLLVAADCTAYAYGNFHQDFLAGKIAVIACPKLDTYDYRKKLADIIEGNSIKSVTVARMEVPCCGGIESAVQRAIGNSGKSIQLEVVTIASNGDIVSRK